MTSIPDQPYAGPCPSCRRRGDEGLLQLTVGVTDDGQRVETVEECTTPGCPFFVRSYAPIDGPTRAEIREAVQTIVEVKPLLCPSCLGKRHWACVVANCECPYPSHPKRVA